MSRILVPVFAFTALLAGSFGFSMAGDLKDLKLRQEVAKQKLTDQVKDAIERSFKQDPVDAKFALRALLTQVKDSADILERDRTPLVQRLQVRLNTVEDAARASAVKQDQKPLRETPPRYKGPATDSGAGVRSTAKDFIDSAKGAQKTHAELIQQREKGKLAMDLGIEKSAVLTDKEFTFPSDWKERSERMKKLFGPQLTAKEVAVLKTLNSTMSIDYNGDKFKAVIDHLQEKTGLTILMDEASVRDLNLDYDDPVNLKLPKISVRTALKKILGDKGLTYIIKEGTIQVMTPKRASEHTVVRTYDVSDLVSPDPRLTMQFGPFVSQFQMQQNAVQLINLIKSSTDPNYWQPNGPGSIEFFPPTKSIIIRASAEMHYQQIPGLFGR